MAHSESGVPHPRRGRPVSRVGVRERLRYWFDNTMAKGTPALIGWLGLASLALVLTVASVAVLIAPRDTRDNGHWPGVVWRSLLRTLDPGTMGDDRGSGPYLALMLTATVGGIFIVSALIGVLTTGLENKIAELRKGRSRIIERDHTVLLGWSEHVFTVVAELVEANKSRSSSYVAILADRDRVDMEEAIRARVGGTGRTKVICRRGDPLKVADLELVSPATARSIVVLSPPVDDPDTHVIKVLLALGARTWEPDHRPHVIAAMHDSTNLPAARLAAGPAAQVIDADDLAIRLIVQSHREAGLSAVFTELLDFEGHELYLHAEPALAGRTFGRLLDAYELGVPIGFRHADGAVTLNPPMDTVARSGDKVIVLAEDDVLIKLASRAAPPVVEDAIAAPGPGRRLPERTLLIGWNHRAPEIIRQLDGFARPGSTLHVAADRPDPTADLPRPANTTFGFTRCAPTDRPSLESLDVGSYQSIIVLADLDLPPEHSDARTLVTLLHLRDMAERLGDPYSIVSEINDETNREIAVVTKADDFVVSDKLINQVLAQVSEDRHLYDVFMELLSPEGAEIYLKPAPDYLRPGVTANFATLIEAARRRGETALGYRLGDRFHQPPDYGVVLNPDKAAPFTLTASDRVIVLTEE
ncbi:CASTOR/POLLUX-related putative ion channel [Actinomadura kijaniata]|uniref:CASTOR/POLLUX-related putative ion channel n=1 Tax=Actinomadura kijaniata TaxID=46161 RepID=UPI000A00F759|nr:potassium transporter TrkA [Actinomadura kijaniata]